MLEGAMLARVGGLSLRPTLLVAIAAIAMTMAILGALSIALGSDAGGSDALAPHLGRNLVVVGVIAVIALGALGLAWLGRRAVAQREARAQDRIEPLVRRTRELERLVAHLEAGREAQARQIAREVHDGLGQSLAVLKMDVSWFRKHLDDVATPEGRAAVTARLAEARATVDSAIATGRAISTALRPSVLDHLGLPAALEWQGQQLAGGAGFRCRLDIDQSIDVPNQVATAMFRIFQELGANITRHANASEVCVKLWRDDGRVVLEVVDDGAGITPRELEDSRSLDLLGVSERAAQCGGTVRFSAAVPRGTIVTVSIPGATT
jgi:signal transduction histidine kinase